MSFLENKLSVAEGRNGVLEKEKGELEVKVADITSDVKSETGVIGKCNYFSLIWPKTPKLGQSNFESGGCV